MSNLSEFALAQRIDDFLVEKAKQRGLYAPGYPSYPGPSSASIIMPDGTVNGACIRASYYSIKGYPAADPEARMQKIFKFGNMIEDMAKDYIKQLGYYEESSIRFYIPSWGIKGELDFILNIPNVGRFIVENKSYYGYDAKKKIQGNTKVTPEPKFENMLQIFIYIYAFRPGNEFGFAPIDGGKILYWSRDDMEVSDFTIELYESDGEFYPKVNGEVYTDITISKIKERYDLLWYYLRLKGDDAKTPPRDYEPMPSDQDIENGFNNGDISKTAYERFKKSPTNFNRMLCSHWRCRYCSYRDTICIKDN